MKTLKQLVETAKALNNLMNYGKVVDFISSQRLGDANGLFADVYISIEQTGPYAQLTTENTFITVAEIEKHYSAQLVRKMQCEVSTWMVEKQWIWQLNEASVKSIKF